MNVRVTRSVTAPPPTVPPETPPPLRAAVTEVFGDVRDALAAGGFDVNKPVCNVAATVMAHALERRGIGQARVVEGGNHLFVELRTAHETLWIDPTAAQFFTDGTPADQFVLSHGLVGTPDEVRGFIASLLDAWKQPASWPRVDGALVARAGGAFDPRLSVDEARIAVAPMVETALLHFTLGPPSYLTAASAGQDAWYRAGREGPLVTRFGSDIGPSLRRVYDRLDGP